ncbi:MAG: leucine-rich repeat protein [Lachnospiraceae bacterium]|nr:leucine-rich repeat protein [Lachnospiraceae bacterium]
MKKKCKRWKKSIISIVVAMILVWSSMPQMGKAHEIYRELLEVLEDTQGLVYSCYDSDGYLCAYVTGYNEDLADCIVIPDEINGYPVERVESQALKGSSVKELFLGNGVKQLGSNALEDCAQLTKVVIGSNLRDLSSESFRGCVALQEIVIENNKRFEVIDNVLYENMQGGYLRLLLYPVGKTDRSFTLSASVTGIDNLYYSPFGGNPYLQEILAEEGSPYTSVDGVLYSNDGTVLESYPAGRAGAEFTVPNNVKTVASHAFYGAVSLKELHIPEGITVWEGNQLSAGQETGIPQQGNQQSDNEQSDPEKETKEPSKEDSKSESKEDSKKDKEDSKKDKEDAKKEKTRSALWLRLLKTIPVLLITWMALDLTRKGRKSGLKMYRVRRVVNGKTVEKIKKRWPLKTHIKTLIILVIAGWLVTQTMECGRPKRVETTNTPDRGQSVEHQEVASTQGEVSQENESSDIHAQDFAQLNKGELKQYQEDKKVWDKVDKKIDEIFSPYQDAEGYMDPAQMGSALQQAYEYLCTLKDKGEIAYCELNDDNVYMRTNHGSGSMYIARLPGVASGCSVSIMPLQAKADFAQGPVTGWDIVSYQTEEWLDNAELVGSGGFSPTVVADICTNIPEYRYQESNQYNQENITLKSLKTMEAHGILFWMGHGGYLTDIGATLDTGIVRTDERDMGFYREIHEGYLCEMSVPNQAKTYGVTPAFWEFYLEENALQDAVIYVGACHSMQDNVLANVFLDKGAKVFFGFKESPRTGYGIAMTEVLRIMSDMFYSSSPGTYPTAVEAFAVARKWYGDIDSVNMYDGLEDYPTGDAQLFWAGRRDARLVENGEILLEVVNAEGKRLEAEACFVKKGAKEELFHLQVKEGQILKKDVAAFDYEVIVSAPGYQSRTVPVSISEDGGVSLKVELARDLAGCFAGGSGTKEDPYRIATEENLRKMSELSYYGETFKDCYFVLERDLVLGDTDKWTRWDPEKNYETNFISILEFSGHFDGQGHTIRGLCQTTHTNATANDKQPNYLDNEIYVGLFHKVSHATISNLTISQSLIKGVSAGAFSMKAEDSVFENCHTKDCYIGGEYYTGGMVGQAYRSIFRSCSNGGTVWNRPVSGTNSWFGGIAGTSQSCHFTECENYGEIRNSGGCNGGIAGISTESNFEKCKNSGTIWGNYATGGIGGYTENCQVDGCVNSGRIHVNADGGGIIGSMHGGSVRNCTYRGSFFPVENIPLDRDISIIGYKWDGTVSGSTVENNTEASTEESNEETEKATEEEETEEEETTEEETTEEETSQVKELTVWVASNNVDQTVDLESYVNVTVNAMGEGYTTMELYELLKGAYVQVSDSSVLSISSRNPIMSSDASEDSAFGSLFIGCTAHKTGTATITVTVGGQTVSATINVE